MPEPAFNGLIISKEIIWSSNTGRAADGSMIGDIVGYKYKLDITFPPLTAQDIAKINRETTKSPFFAVTFIDPVGGLTATRIFYSGAPIYPVYSYATNSKGLYVGVKVSFIER